MARWEFLQMGLALLAVYCCLGSSSAIEFADASLPLPKPSTQQELSMTNLMSFVVNTGTREGDQHEIAQYQQYYQSHGVALAAQPQPQGGFLLTTYQTEQPNAAQYSNAAQHANAAQYSNAAQHANAAQYSNAAQYANAAQYSNPVQDPRAGQATYAAPPAPQVAATLAEYGPAPQQPSFSTKPGFGTPQQHAGAAPVVYGSPPPAAGAAAYVPPPVAGAVGYVPPPRPVGAVAYEPPPQAPNAWAPPQQLSGASSPAAYGVQLAPDAPQAWASLPQDTNAAPNAYGAGFSATAAPGVAAGGGVPAVSPVRIGGAFAKLTLLQKLKFAATGIVVLGLAGWSFFLMRQAQSNVVLFENSLDVPGELSLAGKSYGSISPRQALRLELDAGSYEVSFTGKGSKLDGGILTVPKGNNTIGYRAVYNLGGRKGLAVVTKYYGGTFEDRVAAVAEGTRLVEVPGAQALDRIDDSFPDTITVPKHASYGTVTRVCHVDEAKGSVGCPGW